MYAMILRYCMNTCYDTAVLYANDTAVMYVMILRYCMLIFLARLPWADIICKLACSRRTEW